MAEDKERQEYRKLPTVADLEKETRLEVMRLLETLDAVVVAKEKLEQQEDELKDRLHQLQRETKRPGFRHGWLCFIASKVAGRKTLDKMLLLENGCPASVLNASYKEGSPSVRINFKHLEEEG